MRVFELAKKIGVTSKELQEKLKAKGIDVKSHMSSLDEKTVSLILKPPEETKQKPEPAKEKIVEKKPEPVKEKAPEKKPEIEKRPEPEKPKEVVPEKIIILKEPITVGELAKRLRTGVAELIKKLIQAGVMLTINQYVSDEVVEKVSKEYGFEVKKVIEDKTEFQAGKPLEHGFMPRPPVITVMGHVDHGKTSLLDAIRHSRVAEKEAGAITQHIGAYKIKLDKGEMVFLDTPGHEAFTAMRARGASLTDIIVLVVAADDGIMPQTIEAINHARQADVPIVVAINKIDRSNAKPDRVKQELIKYDLAPEDLGGKTVCVDVSATKKIGIEKLLEMILLEAEMLELKANPSGKAKGAIVEAKMDKRRGPVATVLIQDGTLHAGDVFIAGLKSGKVKFMTDQAGKNIDEAPPSTPVEILGFSEVPYSGDSFEVVADEKTSQEIILKRKQDYAVKPKPVTLGSLHEQIEAGARELKIIIKADVRGSIDALCAALETLNDEKVTIGIIHKVTGDVNESDVILASASNAIIIGFNVKIEDGAKGLADKEGVDIRLYQVIYNAVNDLKTAMAGLLEPVYKEVFTGRAEVRQVFSLPNDRKISGCYVLKGKIVRGAKAVVLRNREKIFEGRITSLKRFKNDAREILEDFECGIGIEGFNDFKEDDLIEIYTLQEEKQ